MNVGLRLFYTILERIAGPGGLDLVLMDGVHILLATLFLVRCLYNFFGHLQAKRKDMLLFLIREGFFLGVRSLRFW